MTTLVYRIPAGLELMYELEKENVKNSLDAFILAIHWAVVRAGLRCKSESQPGEFTERLPANWSAGTPNDGQMRHITLNYSEPQHPEFTYQIKLIELTPNDAAVCTIFRYKTSTVSESSSGTASSSDNTRGTATTSTVTNSTSKTTSSDSKTSAASTFNIGSYIRSEIFDPNQTQTRPSVAAIFYNGEGLETQIWGEMMEPLGLHVLGQPPFPGPYDSKVEDTAPRASVQSERESPLYSDDRNYPRHRPDPAFPGGFGPLYVPPAGGGGLGRSDLDPLGGIGAGMIADPRGFRRPRAGMPGLFPGGHPPGARFDPFGPPNPNRPDAGTGHWAVPNPDAEQPPPGFEDMFM